MTEALDIEAAIKRLERTSSGVTSYIHERCRHEDTLALIADWRAKRAEIERLKANPDAYVEARLAVRAAAKEHAVEAMRARCEAIVLNKLEERYSIAIPSSVTHGKAESAYRQALQDMADAIAALKP